MEAESAVGKKAKSGAGHDPFYFYMTIVFAMVTFIGFAPSYWVPMGRGQLSKPMVLHVHGAIFLGWALFYVYQSWLGATGKTARHKELGILGVAWATTVAFMGIVAAYVSDNMRLAHGVPLGGVAMGLAGTLDMLCFVPFMALALANTRRPEIHKRGMLVAMIALLDAPIVRWINALNPTMPLTWTLTTAPLYAGLLADLLLVSPLIHDWRTRGRPHGVTVVGVLMVAVMDLARYAVAPTAAWQAFTRAFLTAAG